MQPHDALDFARQTIRIQRQGLEALEAQLGEDFLQAIEMIQATSGRVIVTGMGKSGHIGRKISATLASVGTPSYFVHPAEASHGDLGMISENDLVLALSNSGETRELSDVLQYCKRFAIPVIAITSKRDSSLGSQATLALVLPAVPEACPLDKAPTTSTSMTLVLGDALALVLLQNKGFTREAFSVYHPGGKLGAQLLTVQQILNKSVGAVPTALPDTPLQELMLRMSAGRKGCVGILDDTDRLIGIVTDGDLRRFFQRSQALDTPAQALMNTTPKTISGKHMAVDALALMQRNKISVLFAVDDNQHPIGIIHLQDLMQFGVV